MKDHWHFVSDVCSDFQFRVLHFRYVLDFCVYEFKLRFRVFDMFLTSNFYVSNVENIIFTESVFFQTLRVTNLWGPFIDGPPMAHRSPPIAYRWPPLPTGGPPQKLLQPPKWPPMELWWKIGGHRWISLGCQLW